jgi:hypothetical protein
MTRYQPSSFPVAALLAAVLFQAPGAKVEQKSEAPVAAATAAIDRATGAALQANAASAVRILNELPRSAYNGEDADFRDCMVDRFGAKGHLAVPASSDPWIANLLKAFIGYWQHSLTNPSERPQAELELRRAVAAISGLSVTSDGDFDAAEEAIKKHVEMQGLHALSGTTSPLHDLMLWKTSNREQRRVILAEGAFSVRVTFLDDFIVRGWGHYATCGSRSTGGWATEEGLFAVVPAYKNLADETFSVRFLAHETQHFADKTRLPPMASWELEYRAKLTELTLARSSQDSTMQRICENRSPINDSAHAYANYRVIRNIARRMRVGGDGLCAVNGVRGERLRAVAKKMLQLDTAVRRSSLGKDKHLH